MGAGKPRGIKAGRKLTIKRKLNRWADQDYNKRQLNTSYKTPFGGASHAKGIVTEKFGVSAK